MLSVVILGANNAQVYVYGFSLQKKKPVNLSRKIAQDRVEVLSVTVEWFCSWVEKYNHGSQSQRTHTIQWTNQNSKRLHVVDANESQWVFSCTSDWMKKWREVFRPIVWRTHMTTALTATKNSSLIKYFSHCIGILTDYASNKIVRVSAASNVNYWAIYFT